MIDTPAIKIAFCDCCTQKGELREFVGRTVRSRHGQPIHYRLCKSCNSVSDEDFYINLTRKLMRRILEQREEQQDEQASGFFKHSFFGFE